jgi:hypothetical protein
VPVIFGEWWAADTEDIMSKALKVGGAPNISDAYTINGLPGPLYNCSAKGTFACLQSVVCFHASLVLVANSQSPEPKVCLLIESFSIINQITESEFEEYSDPSFKRNGMVRWLLRIIVEFSVSLEQHSDT